LSVIGYSREKFGQFCGQWCRSPLRRYARDIRRSNQRIIKQLSRGTRQSINALHERQCAPMHILSVSMGITGQRCGICLRVPRAEQSAIPGYMPVFEQMTAGPKPQRR